jgi:hypothetical protein
MGSGSVPVQPEKAQATSAPYRPAAKYRPARSFLNRHPF